MINELELEQIQEFDSEKIRAEAETRHIQIGYTANPTARKFHADNNFVKMLRGPIGCGKSLTCCAEILLRALAQKPSPRDGIRYSRWAIIRNTYPELKTTTIKTWQHLFPPALFGDVKKDIPLSHRIRINDVDLEVYFLSIDSTQDSEKLSSFELTGAWINEAREINYLTFQRAIERVGRYPAKIDGGASWHGVILDTNPPDTDHWIYRLFEECRPHNFSSYAYPPGLIKDKDGKWITNTNAENITNLVKDYYITMASSKSDAEIKVQLCGEYGYVQNGRPVHQEYNDALHYADKELKYEPKVEIGLGWDFGITPACIITQLTNRNQLIVLDELWTEGMGLRQFTENIVLPHLNKYYPNWIDSYISVNDPSGNTRSQTDERTCEEILRECGIKSCGAASSNEQTGRKEGLKFFLTRLSDGQPSFYLSSRCKMLRKGLMGGYQYARVKVGGDERYHDKPLKNIYSHSCEALEYIAMHYSGLLRRPKPSATKAFIMQQGAFL